MLCQATVYDGEIKLYIKADISQLTLPHGDNNLKSGKEKN